MTSGKELNLNNLHHVLDIRKNFKLVFVSDKFVLTIYIGKGYLSDGLNKMNVHTIIVNIYIYIYLLLLISLGHLIFGIID